MSNRLEGILRRQFITSDDIRTAIERGDQSLAIPENSTVTDEARELALKLSLRLDAPGQARPAPPATRTGTGPPTVVASATEDTGRRVADAIAAVLGELKLGARAEQLAPVLTRRVFAGLAKVAERK